VAASISGSVGRGGKNIAADVITIQKLINANLTVIAPLIALDEDGACGSLTIGALEAFQRNAVKMAKPDGRVDPGGNTLRVLNGERPIAAFGLRIQFNRLWASYPAVQMPCDGAYKNQCAIRMSISLIGAGFLLGGYTEPRCRHGHARGAESLAQFLSRSARPERLAGAAAQNRVSGRTGILFFRNLTGFRGGEGDHIDVWDGTATKTGAYFTTSQEVWFWPVQ
jgi:Type VI secretion system (T6SS), amidase effector protein 4